MGNQTTTQVPQETISKIKNKAKVLSPLSPKKKQRVVQTYTPAPVKTNFDWLQCYTPTPQKPEPQLPTEFKFEDFVLHTGSVLGEGAFAKVILATHAPTQTKAAVKVISKKSIPVEMKDYVIREPGVLAKLSHKNIVKLYLVHEDTNYIYMFLQYKPGGDVHSRLERDAIVEEDIARVWFKQIIAAVDFSHKAGYCHRDLKLENILISGEGKQAKLLLIDFGFAALMESSTHKFHDFPGSVCYAAPELIQGIPYAGSSADVYSLGVILYTLIQGIYPHYSEDRRELAKMIVNARPEFDAPISESGRSLIQWMLAKDPANRPTMEQIKNHPFLKPNLPAIQPLKTTVSRLKNTARASLSPSFQRRRV